MSVVTTEALEDRLQELKKAMEQRGLPKEEYDQMRDKRLMIADELRRRRAEEARQLS